MKRRWLGLLMIVLMLGGCSRGAAPGGDAGQPTDLKRRELASLPKVGDYSPPIDDGRLEAAPPAGWNVIPRGNTFLIGFAKGKASELPRIMINAEEPPPGTPDELNEDNAAEFAAAQDRSLRVSAKTGKKRVAEYCLPIVLGETVYVRHVRQAQHGNAPCVVQSLQTIRGERLYTIELIAEIDAARAEEYDQSLTKWRDDAYAVAAHLRFAPAGEKLEPLEASPLETKQTKPK